MSGFDIEKVLSPVVTNIPPSGIRKFFRHCERDERCDFARCGRAGFFVTPAHIREAGIASLEDGHTHYTSNSGLAELRAQIAAYMERRFSLKYDGAHEVLVSVGGSEAIDLRCARSYARR